MREANSNKKSFDDIKILVVDDDPSILLATTRILKKHTDYKIVEALNGRTALSKINVEEPDIVLCDVVMDDIDGIEVCRRIKLTHENILVVLISGMSITSEHQTKGLEAGADGYLVRPFDTEEFVARVKAFARIRKSEKRLLTLNEQLHSIVNERTANLNLMVSKVEEEVEARMEAEDELSRSIGRQNDQLLQLEEKNVALKILMHQVNSEKERIIENVSANVRNVLIPLLHNIQRNEAITGSDIKDTINSAISHLSDSFGNALDDPAFNLSPREREICGLLRDGKSSDEIADFLNLSVQTIQTHRKKIRKKLGIQNRKKNLVSFLRSLETSLG